MLASILTCNHHDEYGHAVELVLAIVVLCVQSETGQYRRYDIGDQRDDTKACSGFDVRYG